MIEHPVNIRTASLEELSFVNEQIDEFEDPYTLEVFEERLSGVTTLALVAEEDGHLLGFKVGYELEPGVFYSWMGGVVSNARGKGVASALLDYQEAWVRDQGYTEIRVKTRNVHRNMINMLLKYDYLVTGVELADDPRQNRILFSKMLSV